MSNARCRCGGGRAHHEHDTACWCPRCLPLPHEDRCTNFAPRTPVSLPALPARPRPDTGPEVDTESHSSAEKPTTGRPAHRELVARQVAAAGAEGATPGELATLLRLRLKAVSAALADLSSDGEVVLDGEPRTVGSSSEDVWRSLRPSDTPEAHQTALWS